MREPGLGEGVGAQSWSCMKSCMLSTVSANCSPSLNLHMCDYRWRAWTRAHGRWTCRPCAGAMSVWPSKRMGENSVFVKQTWPRVNVWLGHQPLEVEMTSIQDQNIHVWYISELIHLFHFCSTKSSLMSTSSWAIRLRAGGLPKEV